VRRRPYSVVLLDEIEKAHSDVHELFFQVFDKGWMEDSEGRYIDFTNTIILLTSNAGTERIVSLCKDPELMPSRRRDQGAARAAAPEVPRAARPPGGDPYYPLSDQMIATSSAAARTHRERVVEHHKIPFEYDEAAVKLIVSAARGRERWRMIDTILTNTVLPAISREFLTRTMSAATLTGVGCPRPAATSRTRSTARRRKRNGGL